MSRLPSPLDNPIWNALTSHQSNLAAGDELARRFPLDIGPLAGLTDQSQEAYTALTQVPLADKQLVFFLDTAPTPSPEWHIDVHGYLTQMVLDQPLPEIENNRIEVLDEKDVPEMLALTKLTNPGPFRQRTIELGTYLGIRESGHLIAMAGERLHLEGYTEISAVCTHPDFQGKGHAKALMVAVAKNILNRGETPFLHAWKDNVNAIKVYEKLGFTHRRYLDLAVFSLANPT